MCRTSRNGSHYQWACVSLALSARRKSGTSLASGFSGNHHNYMGQSQPFSVCVCICCLQRDKQMAITQPAQFCGMSKMDCFLAGFLSIQAAR